MLDRFMDKVSPEPNSGCWLWTATVDRCGYGLFGVGGSGNTRRAHRVSYQLHVGEIPAGQIILHKCDNPTCVNPDHLQVGSHADNSADRNSKMRHAYGERSGAAVLTEELVQIIRSSRLSERQIAKDVGVHRSTVNAVRSGRTWRHVA